MNATANAADQLIQTAIEQLKEGLFEEAIDGFTAAIAVDPTHAKSLEGRATARFQLKDWANAEKDFLAAKTAAPEVPENWMGLALSMAMQNRVYMAMDIYNELLSHMPDYVPAFVQLGLLYFKIGAITKGRDYLKEALNHRPTLAQRKMIESQLGEQDKLDKNRYYRPDFERLNGKTSGFQMGRWFRRIIQSIAGR